MKNSYYFVLVIMLFAFSCNTETNNSVSDASAVKQDSINQVFDNSSRDKKSDTTAKKDNVTQSADTHLKIDTTLKSVFLKEYNSLVNLKLKRWSTYYKTKSSLFNINKFSLCNTEYLNPYLIDFFSDETDMKKFLKLYAPYLIWNSDSSKAIDLYSTGVYLEFDESGKKYMEYGEDNHVHLIDFKNKKIIVLMQRGPFSHFDDGFWMDGNTILITEIGKNLENEIIDENFIIEYHVINLNTYQTSRYCSKQSYKIEDSFLSLVFKGIKGKKIE